MGEIADMMIEGDLCAMCGSFIDEEGGSGFPRYCSPQCARDAGVARTDNLPARLDGRMVTLQLPANTTIRCPICNKKTRAIGYADHQRDSHKAAPAPAKGDG